MNDLQEPKANATDVAKLGAEMLHSMARSATSERSIITAYEIFHDKRADEQILIVPAGRPIHCGRAFYFRRDEMRVMVNNSACS